MPILDPGLKAYAEEIERLVGPVRQPYTVEDRRARMETIAGLVALDRPDGLTTKDWFIAARGREIPIRIYRPTPDKMLPLVLFFHGGGFVAGSTTTHDYLASALSHGADCVVVSVHYRRAPENPFPAPCDDCYEALLWSVAHSEFLNADASRIAVAGDSAGAHLAIGCALRARQENGPRIAAQILMYPTVEPDFQRASYLEFADAPFLTRNEMIAFWHAFLPGGLDTNNPLAVPTRAASLSGLPSAFIVSAEIDPLRDEGEAFGEALRKAGVRAETHRAAGLAHGFLRARDFSASVRAEQTRIVTALRNAIW